MARISLKEAYDNRDVIAWLVKHEDEIDELMNILKDIDPDGDLTNVVTKTGDQTIDGIKTFIGKIVADCDIIQNGGNYETHAEQVFTTNDYIVMRDGAVSGLGTGQFSGFQVKKYNGSDDGRLVIDNAGVARVGDIGDEQPLATRDEASNMTSGALVKWDGVNERMIAPASNVGSDTQPVKIVNGEPVQIGNVLENSYIYDSASNISLPAGWIQTKICSLTLPKGAYLFIGQTHYLSGNGELTSGLIINGVQRWLCQYNSTINNVNHLNFAYIIDIPNDNTEVDLYSYSQYARTCDGVLISMKLI